VKVIWAGTYARFGTFKWLTWSLYNLTIRRVVTPINPGAWSVHEVRKQRKSKIPLVEAVHYGKEEVMM